MPSVASQDCIKVQAAQEENPIDFSRDDYITPFGHATLKDRYLQDDETSPQQAFRRAARAFSDDAAHASRMYYYISNGWLVNSTPTLTNAPKRNSWGQMFEDNFKPHHFEKISGLPISCFLNEAGDSRVELTEHYAENSMLSSMGGGLGSYWGGIRTSGMNTSSGSVSSGMIPFLGVVDRLVLAFAQGKTRRASCAAWVDMHHPEIIEFMNIRKSTGGDMNRKSTNLHNGVCISDKFMEIIERCMQDPNADDSWDLIDPKHNTVVDTVSARALWEQLLTLRAGSGRGEPYIMFTDTVNRALPESQKLLGLVVKHSNLCTEITLAVNKWRTAVCCLSSVNAALFDQFKNDPMFIPDCIRYLDNVIEFFINHGETFIRDEDREEIRDRLRSALPQFSDEQINEISDAVASEFTNSIRKAIFSAKQERSVGLGILGMHTYLQMNKIPFESALAVSVNRELVKHIDERAIAATRKLAEERGACPDALDSGVRNMHRTAIAPNATSSIYAPNPLLKGAVSPSTEPFAANAFTHKTTSGSWAVRNPVLERTLESYGRNDDATWSSITLNDGSCQHLDFMTSLDKDIFKTAIEIDQHWVIELAAHRQERIDQSQSLNTFFAKGTSIAHLHSVHFMAWKRGIKSLYYVRSEPARKAEAISVKIDRVNILEDGGCLACE